MQRKMDNLILGITLRDGIPKQARRNQTGVRNAEKAILYTKFTYSREKCGMMTDSSEKNRGQPYSRSIKNYRPCVRHLWLETSSFSRDIVMDCVRSNVFPFFHYLQTRLDKQRPQISTNVSMVVMIS